MRRVGRVRIDHHERLERFTDLPLQLPTHRGKIGLIHAERIQLRDDFPAADQTLPSANTTARSVPGH